MKTRYQKSVRFYKVGFMEAKPVSLLQETPSRVLTNYGQLISSKLYVGDFCSWLVPCTLGPLGSQHCPRILEGGPRLDIKVASLIYCTDSPQRRTKIVRTGVRILAMGDECKILNWLPAA